VYSLHASISRRGGADLLPGRIARPVVNDEQFPGETGGIEDNPDFGDERADVPRLVPHRDDERDVRRRGSGGVHAFGSDGGHPPQGAGRE